jgi:hypothetical protein
MRLASCCCDEVDFVIVIQSGVSQYVVDVLSVGRGDSGPHPQDSKLVVEMGSAVLRRLGQQAMVSSNRRINVEVD